MSNMLFYMGKGGEPIEAIKDALQNCAPVLEVNPSLVIQLLDVNHCGTHWEAHIRLMAIEASDSDGARRKTKADSASKIPRSPEHFRSGNPFEWRPIGMTLDLVNPLGNFDQAAYGGGFIPDIPTQELEDLKKAGFSDLDIRTKMSNDGPDLKIVQPKAQPD